MVLVVAQHRRRSALDYLINVRGMTLPEAVLQIDGQAAVMPPVLSKVQEPTEPKNCCCRRKTENNDRVIAYLMGRGIHRDITATVSNRRLYESRDYHNAVFIGFGRHGVPKYLLSVERLANVMGEVNGSVQALLLLYSGQNECSKLHLFESAIDLLSYGTLELLSGRTGGRKTACLLQESICRKRLLRKAPHPRAHAIHKRLPENQ
jgi:hypothetical protein